MKELVALAKARPGQVNMASTGSGGLLHLAMEMLKIAATVNMTHVPYNGAAPAVAALVGGQVHGMFADLPVVLPYVQAGRSGRSRWRARSARASCPICRP